MLHSSPLFRCYFGTAKDSLDPAEYLALSNAQDILSLKPFAQLKKSMQLHRLTFLRQTHSVNGLAIADTASAHKAVSFTQSGDYLITNQKNNGLGIMTADCLPVIIIDTMRGALGIAHAGWRGTVAGISVTMLHAMQDTFGTNREKIKVFFGPAAKCCCYKVSNSFLSNLEHLPFNKQLIIERNNQYYFDKALCNRLLLQNAGVKKESFYVDYNICTICDTSFYSHRRGDNGRQMTVVSLV